MDEANGAIAGNVDVANFATVYGSDRFSFSYNCG